VAQLKDKIENALNETRILVLGIQILIGFGFRGFFEPGFSKMAPYAQQIELAALGLMLAGLGVLLIPVPYHCIVLHGRNTAELHRLATATVTIGLLPFALAMALSFFLGAHWVVGTLASAMLGGIALALTLFAWYGFEFVARSRKLGKVQLYAIVDPLREIDMKQEQETDLTTRIKQALIECRIVLPGAQALLGFQLIIMWMTAFYKIPQWWKVLHLASLTSIGVCTVLLITPAAYHRIVEQGEDSERLYHITAHLLLWSMVFLALGICGDFYIASRMTGLSNAVSTAISSALLVFFFAAWFGYTLWKKDRIRDKRLTESHLKASHAA
jgi:hypothetical protein